LSSTNFHDSLSELLPVMRVQRSAAFVCATSLCVTSQLRSTQSARLY
jgi:hypothetical protein